MNKEKKKNYLTYPRESKPGLQKKTFSQMREMKNGRE